MSLLCRTYGLVSAEIVSNSIFSKAHKKIRRKWNQGQFCIFHILFQNTPQAEALYGSSCQMSIQFFQTTEQLMIRSSFAMENKLAIHVNLLRSWSSSQAYIGL
jgi:hypothetical protein